MSNNFRIRPFLQYIAFLLAALLVCGSLSAASTESATVKDVRRLIGQGNLTGALIVANNIIDKRPRDTNARFLKGLILTRLHQSEEAIQIFKALTQDFPEFAEPWNNLAVLYAQQGQLDEAKEALLMAIRTYPDYAVPYENLGDIYLRLAIQSYAKANSLDPQSAKIRLELSRELLKQVNSLDMSATEAPKQNSNAMQPATDKAKTAEQNNDTVQPATDKAKAAEQNDDTVQPATDKAKAAEQNDDTVQPATDNENRYDHNDYK